MPHAWARVINQQIEEVGVVSGGLAAAEWSPDGDVLAAVSGTGCLLLMNQVRRSSHRRRMTVAGYYVLINRDASPTACSKSLSSLW